MHDKLPAMNATLYGLNGPRNAQHTHTHTHTHACAVLRRTAMLTITTTFTGWRTQRLTHWIPTRLTIYSFHAAQASTSVSPATTRLFSFAVSRVLVIDGYVLGSETGTLGIRPRACAIRPGLQYFSLPMAWSPSRSSPGSAATPSH